MKDFFTSSSGEGIALRIKAGIPLLIFVLGFFGFQTSEADFTTLTETIVQVFTGIGMVVAGYYEVVGWIRMMNNKRNKLGKYAE